MRILWLADVLRAAGLTVVEHRGWETRGWEPWTPAWGIAHATAAPRTQADSTQVAIVRDGRKGLPGPIANACVDRQGRWHVLASGRCNTALRGWAGPAEGRGNTNLLGVEACNDNGLWSPPEPWPDAQYEAYARGWAAICRRMGWDAGRVVGHKEHQPGDKSDPRFDMGRFRAAIQAELEQEMEDDMDLSDKIPYRGRESTVGSALTWTWTHAGDSKVMLRDEVLPRLAAIEAAVAGEDVAAAVRAELDRHRAALVAELAPLLAEELRDVPAEQVEAAVARVLARTRLTVDAPEAG